MPGIGGRRCLMRKTDRCFELIAVIFYRVYSAVCGGIFVILSMRTSVPFQFFFTSIAPCLCSVSKNAITVLLFHFHMEERLVIDMRNGTFRPPSKSISKSLS